MKRLAELLIFAKHFMLFWAMLFAAYSVKIPEAFKLTIVCCFAAFVIDVLIYDTKSR